MFFSIIVGSNLISENKPLCKDSYHENFVYILVAVIVFVGYILRLVWYFNVIFFAVPSNIKRKLPVNNQNIERGPLMKGLDLKLIFGARYFC